MLEEGELFGTLFGAQSSGSEGIMRAGPVRLPSDRLSDEEKAQLSGPCRVYRPGEWEWAEREPGRRGEIEISILRNGVGISAEARRALGGGDKIWLMVGYDGARRLIGIRRADGPGRHAYLLGSGSKIGGRRLTDWLKERGFGPGTYRGRKEGDMLVFGREAGS